ncbi:MAG: type II toxin-antitoxin system VapC family toxin [Gemmatimonadota bacterium]
MAGSVFIDTSGWYALIDRRDTGHEQIAALVREHIQGGGRLVSTDYVIDESCTLTRARAGSVAAMRFLDLVHHTAALDLEWVGPERFAKAKACFRKHHDQAFSFTDCTSFVVMRECRVTAAITSDDHFRIAGFRLLPERTGRARRRRS